METRNKYIFSIIAGWVFFIFILLAISAYLSISGFISIEKKVAIDNSERVKRVLLAKLEPLYFLNSDYSYWDETYNFITTKNEAFIKTNLADDFFKSNKINYVMLIDTSGDLVWGKGFDLVNNTYTNIPEDILGFFKKNNKFLISYRDEYNDLIKKQYGIGGLLPPTTNGDIVYFVMNEINTADENTAPNGYLIFAKILSPVFMQDLSKELGFTITFGSIKNYLNTASDDVKIQYLDSNTILGSIVINDINKKPLSALEIQYPRVIYKESIASFWKNGVILLIFSLFGMFSMAALVYGFFKKQELITDSFERFVPHELIELLNKKSILEVILGTNSKTNLTVLFMDIRNFTSISEGLSPQESFDFLNTILKEIAPIVIRNQGFIDKYIGDAIMALFPKQDSNADNAVAAGMMILDEMDKLNYTGKVKFSFPVKVGIGINTGNSILGIIGTEGRLEGTVISDAVNTASRIQNMTKNYDAPLLISEETYKSMKHPEFYNITRVDEVQVKGKSIKITLYKVEKRK